MGMDVNFKLYAKHHTFNGNQWWFVKDIDFRREKHVFTALGSPAMFFVEDNLPNLGFTAYEGEQKSAEGMDPEEDYRLVSKLFHISGHDILRLYDFIQTSESVDPVYAHAIARDMQTALFLAGRGCHLKGEYYFD